MADVIHLAQALSLKACVSNRQHFICNQDLAVEMRRYRESEAHVHAARVAFHRGVDELLDFGKSDDLIEPRIDLPAFHSEHCAVEVDVLAPAQIRVEAGADLEQAGNPPV